MTKERELLHWAWSWVESGWDADPLAIIEEIRTHLAAEEGKQEEEPLFYISKHTLNQCLDDSVVVFTPRLQAHKTEGNLHCIPVFLHPSPQDEQMKPLSEVEISNGWLATSKTCRISCFEDGVRFAEKHHGIGEEDE